MKKPLDVGGRSKSRHSWRPAPSLGLRLCHGNLGSASGGLGRAGGCGPAPRSARGRRPRVARPDRCPGVRPRARVSSLRAPPGRPPRPCAPVPASRGGGGGGGAARWLEAEARGVTGRRNALAPLPPPALAPRRRNGEAGPAAAPLPARSGDGHGDLPRPAFPSATPARSGPLPRARRLELPLLLAHTAGRREAGNERAASSAPCWQAAGGVAAERSGGTLLRRCRRRLRLPFHTGLRSRSFRLPRRRRRPLWVGAARRAAGARPPAPLLTTGAASGLAEAGCSGPAPFRCALPPC